MRDWLQSPKRNSYNSGDSHITQTCIQQKEETNERFADYLNKLIAEPPANSKR